jgi:hypothetical protein
VLPLYPEFGWSWSRHKLYRLCPRKFWLRVYLAWGGWDAPTGSPASAAYRLSKLTTLPLAVGTLVHSALRELAEVAAAGGELPSFEALWTPRWTELSRIRHTPRELFVQSPKANPMLADAYYGLRLERELTDALQDAGELLSRCLVNALEMPIWPELATAARVRPPDTLEKSRVHILGDPDPIVWWGAPDLAYVPASRETVDLIDYKTGDSVDGNEAAMQIHTYAAYLIAGTGAIWDRRWRGRVISVRSTSEEAIPITREGIHRALAVVEADVRRWRMHQSSREPNRAEMARFPTPVHRGHCPFCEMAEVCQRMDLDAGTIKVG